MVKNPSTNTAGKPLQRVIVTRPMIGIFGMGVCACKDAPDVEILEVCNRENPAGTSNGWGTVVRESYEWNDMVAENSKPVPCADDPERVHYIVLC